MEKQITAVLIDTSAYHNRQCDFAGIMSAMVPTFLRLMETNHIPVLSHPVLDSEIRKHIYESDIVKRAENLCKMVQKNKAIMAFAGFGTQEILEQASAEKVADSLISEYEELAKSFVMLPYVDAQEVFADYFSTRPPFSATGDKKSEFPDAFVLKGLLKYCTEHHDEQILVISDDPDWKKTLTDNSQIQMVNTLKDGLTYLWSQLGDKAEFVWRIWSAKTEDIMIEIASSAESEAFCINDIYELEDIEISNVRTTSMVGNMTPLEITEDSVLVHATVSLAVDGMAEYLDENRSVWDKEDGIYYFLAYSRMTFQEASAEAECEVRLGFPADGSMNPIEIKDVRITNKWDICIDVSEADVTYEDITDYGEDAWRAEQAEALAEYHNH
jgi:hypothetical protein